MAPVERAPRIRELVGTLDLAFLRELVARIGSLHLGAFAAGLAYGAVFALVPVLALLVLLLGLFNAESLVARAIDQLQDVLPPDALSLIEDQLLSVAATEQSGSYGVGVLFSVGVALWGASGAMRRVIEALNVVHRVEDTRSFVRRLVVSVLLAVGAIVTLAAMVAIMVLGGNVAERVFHVLGIGGAAGTWDWLRWPLLLALAWLAVAVAYRFAPASRVCGGFATPGTLVAIVGWVGFSVAFSWYVGSVGSFDSTWGPVAGVIVFLLYLQYAGLIVLVGAAIDVLLWDRLRPASGLRRVLRGGPPA
jgi:membrane protein